MAHIFKFPNPKTNNKGLITFTHNEWEWFFKTPETHPVLQDLKSQFYLGFNAARYHGKIKYPDIIDYCFSSPSLIEIENGHTINIPWLDRNLLPPEFDYYNKGERFYDIITISKATKFKHVKELLQAIRVLFNKKKYYKCLLLIPSPPAEEFNPNNFDLDLVEYLDTNFTWEEKKYISLLKLHPKLGFNGASQQSVSFLYNNSKVMYKGSETEGTCRAFHEGLVSGCVAVYYKHHRGALVDYVDETNSVPFSTTIPSEDILPNQVGRFDPEEIASCLDKAVTNYEELKPNHEDMREKMLDFNYKDKLYPWFRKLYQKDNVEFDKGLVNTDNIHNRLCGHYMHDPWINPNPKEPTTAIKSIEQLSILLNYINKNLK